MEAVDFRIWKKRKTAGKTAAFDPAFGRNPAGGGRFPRFRIRKIRKSGQGRDRKKRKQKGERRQNNSMKDCWKKGWKIPWNAWRESGK